MDVLYHQQAMRASVNISVISMSSMHLSKVITNPSVRHPATHLCCRWVISATCSSSSNGVLAFSVNDIYSILWFSLSANYFQEHPAAYVSYELSHQQQATICDRVSFGAIKVYQLPKAAFIKEHSFLWRPAIIIRHCIHISAARKPALGVGYHQALYTSISSPWIVSVKSYCFGRQRFIFGFACISRKQSSGLWYIKICDHRLHSI